MKSISIIICSAPDVKTARKLSDILLKEKLAACVSIIPGIESHYVWEGKREKSPEVLLWIKTTENLFKKVEKIIQKEHPYDCPEILQVSVNKSFGSYHNWILEQVEQN